MSVHYSDHKESDSALQTWWKRWRRDFDSDTSARECLAALTGLFFVFLFPVVLGLLLLFIACWLWILGISGGHGILFGFMSTKHFDKDGHAVWGISRTVPSYFMGVITAYLLYQLWELCYTVAYKPYKKALS